MKTLDSFLIKWEEGQWYRMAPRSVLADTFVLNMRDELVSLSFLSSCFFFLFFFLFSSFLFLVSFFFCRLLRDFYKAVPLTSKTRFGTSRIEGTELTVELVSEVHGFKEINSTTP